jgi:hypothetical protein
VVQDRVKVIDMLHDNREATIKEEKLTISRHTNENDDKIT